MMRTVYYIISLVMIATLAIVYPFWHHVLYFLFIVAPYILIGLYDVFLSHSNVLKNYPVIGHIRYMFEFIRPEIQQYFVATNQSGRPYNREQRTLVYERAEDIEDFLPFGTQQDIDSIGYVSGPHSLAPKKPDEKHKRVLVGGSDCKKPYDASRLNISAMSFGALSRTAVEALNLGAKIGGFAHNTGEGGVSPYHLKNGGDIIFQVGTGYFGCRDKKNGTFDPELFKTVSNDDRIKMIEIKLSQGAKPSHGGVLPAAKVSAEIAGIRGVAEGEDCISPPAHSAFQGPIGLLEFVVKLRELSGGKPVGFKLCIGHRSEFMAICKAMIKTQIYPDFITIDGAEGGTGAAPIEFSNRLGVTINEALTFVQNTLVGSGLRDKLHVIASAKIVTGFDMVAKIALGADLCNMARPMLFALGCIQAIRCNTNTCPTGITTQNPTRYRAIDVPLRGQHVANFHRNTMKSFLDVMGAMGIDDPVKLNPDLIFRQIEDDKRDSYANIYVQLQPGQLLSGDVPAPYQSHWDKARAEEF